MKRTRVAGSLFVLFLCLFALNVSSIPTVWAVTRGEAHVTGIPSVAGKITQFRIPTHNSSPYMIAQGPDGNLWFTEFTKGQIGRITPEGQVTEFPLPSQKSRPFGITSGSDGNVWFTEFKKNNVGRITPSGTITEFSIPSSRDSQPFGITSGPDGNIWFTEYAGNKIGRITTS